VKRQSLGSFERLEGRLCLADGDNELIHAGTIDDDLFYFGADGTDLVRIAEEAAIAGNAIIRLGSGDNSVTHAGSIEGDLRVSSANEEDSVEVDDGTVGGETEVNLGEESIPDRPERRFGRGRFGGHFPTPFGLRPAHEFDAQCGGRSRGFRGLWR